MSKEIVGLLGKDADFYLAHECKTISKSLLNQPGSDFVDRVWKDSDRNIQTIRSLSTCLIMVALGVQVTCQYCLLTKV